jgi:hypothetical protein
MVFAKNSDRPIGEVQIAMAFGRRASVGCTLRTQYLSIGDTGASAALLSCPTWLWGAEHGVNEHGVAIGNERVFTVHDAPAAKPALIGMDMVRLGLERARSAEQAVTILGDLLTTHGQGGVADQVHQSAYDSSFLIADPTSAFILETSGRDYAAAPLSAGGAISNRLSLGTDWTRASDQVETGEDFDRFRDPDASTASADLRLAASQRFLAAQAEGAGLDARGTVAHLRDHGHGPWGAPGAPGPIDRPPADDGSDVSGVSVCMHVRGRVVTAASMVAVLPSGLAEGAPLRTFVALGSPCTSIYVPCFAPSAAGPTPFVSSALANADMWQAADALRQVVERDPEALVHIRAQLDPVEGELWAEADEVVDHPERWYEVGATWGPRALAALSAATPR